MSLTQTLRAATQFVMNPVDVDSYTSSTLWAINVNVTMRNVTMRGNSGSTGGAVRLVKDAIPNLSVVDIQHSRCGPGVTGMAFCGYPLSFL